MSVTLSIIVPVYNEAEHLRALLGRVLDVCRQIEGGVQIVVVDDGSTDASDAVVRDVMREQPEAGVELLSHGVNYGKGHAIRTALPVLKGAYTVIQDGDEEYHPSDLVEMLHCMQRGQLRVLYGSRYLGGGRRKRSIYPLYYYGVRLLSWTTNLLYQQQITDEATCYKMFDTSLLQSLNLTCEGFEFCPEVTARIALRRIRIAEIPIQYTPRSIADGKKIRARHGMEALWILLKYRLKAKG